MKLLKVTSNLNPAFQKLKVVSHQLSLRPPRLLKLLKRYQKYQMHPFFSKWRNITETQRVVTAQDEAGPKALALRDYRIEKVHLDSLLLEETKAYTLPKLSDGLKRKVFTVLKTNKTKSRILKSIFSCPNPISTQKAFSHWKL